MKNSNRMSKSGGKEFTDYRFDDSRTNIPPAKIAAEGTIPNADEFEYSYSPRLAPELRFDETGKSDFVQELLKKASVQMLSDNEIKFLEDSLKLHEPWLEWTGKRETNELVVNPVALHIHERVSAQAILKAALRQDVERNLFGDPELEYLKAVQFYEHEIDWVNRLILGDSVQVMSSLIQRENMAEQVQMVYFDPPYGISFSSNFQVNMKERVVKDQAKYLTREPEMIKAYRDTWTLGIHSYLTYIRDRLLMSKHMLKETGSIFVQIGDENLPVVAMVCDEVFGRGNRVQIITIKKKSSTVKGQSIVDYILWYAKDRNLVKMPDLYRDHGLPEDSDKYRRIELPSGERRPAKLLTESERQKYSKFYVRDDYTVVSQGVSAARTKPIIVEGKEVFPSPNNQWRYDPEVGLKRLEKANRLRAGGNSAFGIVYWGDIRLGSIPNVWTDTHGEANPIYVVQTNRKIVERCMLMSTEPGDLVLDPTCGSGTTAFVAEKWGRRWITIDTSRVAIALARQRLLTSNFEYYKLKDDDASIVSGFQYKTEKQVTLHAIATNESLDPIFEKYDSILDSKLEMCNKALSDVDNDVRAILNEKLLEKRKNYTDAEERRWNLPEKGNKFYHWTVPFDTDPDWPKKLCNAVKDYRLHWRKKMDEVNKCNEDNAEYVELRDKPTVDTKILRVCGPFSVEAVQPPENSLDGFDTEIQSQEGDELLESETVSQAVTPEFTSVKNLEAYLDQMINLLRTDGVRFPDNKQMKFSHLDPVDRQSSLIHAEGIWVHEASKQKSKIEKPNVAVAFGPQYGPVTAFLVEQLLRDANRRGYDDLVIAGFSFDGNAQAIIDESTNLSIRVHSAYIRPDVNPGMDGLLSDKPGGQLFTIFGQPRISLSGPDTSGYYTVKMEGVDIFDPVRNSVDSVSSDRVVSWFLDSDYDGRTFCVTQAFFPDKSIWKKFSRGLKDVIDLDALERFSGTESLPFKVGKKRCIAVKVIDPRGNEVMCIRRLED